jgi:hypothetical protein
LNDFSGLGKVTVAMCINLQTGLDWIRGLSVFEFADLCMDYKEALEDMKRHGK